ncbi:hypothetical protein KQX54_009553 [Cotesia glomerata]|uniref:Uncharacterized protein n=1 Tax=Cotesia glomerata TaxID=32391 RepID=A0AAV7IK14_COTGL|nr:hypothetical protein KQX54_009553 [Cotesia glomerata]
MADGKATMHTKRKITDSSNLNPVNKIQKAHPQRQIRVSTEMLDREYKKIIMKAQNDKKFRPNLNVSRSRQNSSSETDKDGWQNPKKPSDSQGHLAASTSNRYGNLTIEKNNDDDIEDDLMDVTEDGSTANITDTNVNVNTKLTAPKQKDHKPPPIIIIGVKINDAIKLLCDNKITKNDVRLKQVSPKDNITIICFNLDVYAKVNKVFIDNQTQYYTYTPKSQKPKSIVLKGVNGDFNKRDIKKELEELQIPNVQIIKVNPIIFKNKHGQDIKHHLVQVTNDSVI